MSAITRENTKFNLKIKLPKNYKIILLNNEQTSPEAVVEVLNQIFLKNAQESKQIMLKAHQTGKAIVSCPVTKELAEAKIEQASFFCKQKDIAFGYTKPNYSALKFESEEE